MMNQVAVQIDNQIENTFTPYVINGRKSEVTENSDKLVLFLGVALIVLQILDGILTGFGMSAFGIEAEGNGLLRNLMSVIGFVPALICSKLFAVSVVVVICKNANRFAWIRFALSSLVVFYTFAAVVPWTMILSKIWF